MIVFYCGKLQREDMKIHYHKLLMFVGIFIQTASLLWKASGFILYSFTGVDYPLFHLLYLFMHEMSESLVVCLIILIGFGWTINFMKIEGLKFYAPLSNFKFNLSYFLVFRQCYAYTFDKATKR
jgi:hypothetical protein